MGLVSFFKNLGKRFEPLDLSIFNDKKAYDTDWEPLKKGGVNFRAYKLKFLEGTRIEFVPTVTARITPLFFIFGSLIPLLFIILKKPDLIQTHWYIVLMPLVLFVVGVLLLLKYSKKPVFDGLEGIYYKGKKPEDTQLENSKNFALINDIYALQLIRERVSTSKSSFYSYELNLVLKNGHRLNVAVAQAC